MISANGVEYKNVPEQVQYLTKQIADIWTAIEGINPPDLTLYALKTYVDAADSTLGTRITAVENSIGTLLTKTEAANTYAKIADIGTYINLSDYVKTVDMYTYVQAEIQNFDLDSNTDFTALKSRVSTLESSVSSMTSDIADANATAANAQTTAGNAVNTANNASAVATNAYNTATSAASDVADMQTTINNYDSRIDAVESTVDGFQASLTTAQNTANAALAKADSALSMIAGLHSLTKQEVEFEGDSVTVAGFVEGSLCTLTKLEGNTEKSENLLKVNDIPPTTKNGVTYSCTNGIVTVNGTCTEQTNVFLATETNTRLPSGQLSYRFINRASDIYELQLASPDNNTFINPTNENQAGTVTNSSADNRWYFALVLRAGKTYSNTKFACMVVKGSTAPTSFVPYYTGLKSVSIAGLSTGGGVVITTSEGTTSLIPTLDDDTLELGSYDYIEQVINDAQLTTSLIQEGAMVDLGMCNWYVGGGTGWCQTLTLQGTIKPCNNNLVADIIANGYTAHSVNNVYSGIVDKSICVNDSGAVQLRNSDFTGKTASEVKELLTGVKLYYRKATPVTTVLATVTYTDVSAFFETGAAITVNNANTEYGVESTSTMYGYVAE